jgi:hypothetical protein
MMGNKVSEFLIFLQRFSLKQMDRIIDARRS